MLASSQLAVAHAQARSSYDATARIFRLDGGDVTYAFGITDRGYLTSVYWGGRIGEGDRLGPLPSLKDHSSVDMSVSITPQEYPGQGGGLFTEPALKVAWPDGSRDVVLQYVSHQMGRDSITVVLKDIARPLRVTLHYTIDPETGIVGRSASIENLDREAVRLDQVQSASYTLPVGDDYRLHYLTGRWAAEWTLQTRPLTEGSTVLESRRGSTSHQANPWFAIDHVGGNEQSGEVWFGALAWSGSWRMTIDRDQIGRARVVGGFNPFDFSYHLKAGERLETPTFYAGYSGQGMGEASRLMHRFQRTKILPGNGSPKLRPVLYNSWEATEFKVDEAGQMALAEKAARIGVERFVMDDGWFGARNSDKAGLGDWTVNPAKFPKGLKPLIDKVKSLGMEFGLWVEPEMVNPDSDLYRAHPDWVINFPGRPRSEGRNQLVLNLARGDVRDHIMKVLDDLVSANDIKFLKWDHNRNWSEPGWPEVAPEDQQRLYVDYVRNLYWIIAELRRRHPGLEIETCSGGGGRVDLGILALTDQAWPSDNTDPFDRLTIQDGFSHAYAPAVMMAWVTDSPNWVNRRTTSLEYRFLSAMQGGLGVGANLNHWGEEDFKTASRMIADYKAVRATVQQGDLYRLISPQAGSNSSATLSVSGDRRQAVLFTFLHSSTKLDPLSAVRLQGLDPDKRYRVRRIGAVVPSDEPGAQANPAEASGAYWMRHGIDVNLKGDFQAAGFIFDALP